MRRLILAALAVFGMSGAASATVLTYTGTATLTGLGINIDQEAVDDLCFVYNEDGLPCPYPGPGPFPDAEVGQQFDFIITAQIYDDGYVNLGFTGRPKGFPSPYIFVEVDPYTGALSASGGTSLDGIPILNLANGTGTYSILAREWIADMDLGTQSPTFSLEYTVTGLEQTPIPQAPIPASAVLLFGALSSLALRRKRLSQ